MANYAETKYNYDGAYLTGIQGVNTGIVVPWGSASIPAGFLLCNGQAVSRSTYADLFAVIGTTYGVGDGSTTFNVPDLQDKTICGVSAANSKSLAQSVGANTVTPTGNVGGNAASTTLATTQIAAHTHSGAVGGNFTSFAAGGEGSFFGNAATSGGTSGSTGGGQGHTHSLSANFTGTANSVLQPTLVMNYIIKT